ncbi:MAG: protein kinase [Myxococcota bacterium]
MTAGRTRSVLAAMVEHFGRYVLTDRVASGGMAEIFRGAVKGAQGFRRPLAIKRIRPEWSADEDFIRMLVDEAKIASTLHHPNVVQVTDLGVIGNQYFIAMEYVEGKHLGAVIGAATRGGTKVPVPFALHAVRDALQGLGHAHGKKDSAGKSLGIVHRDISPQNILVGFDGSVRVADFGIAKALGRATHTDAGIRKGKYPYMSPEQARGDDVDHRTDLYAMGVVLWEALAGHRLYPVNLDEVQVLAQVSRGVRRSLKEVAPEVAPELVDVVERALALLPEDRFQSAEEFAHALSHLLGALAPGYAVGELAAYMTATFAAEAEHERRKCAELESTARKLTFEEIAAVAQPAPSSEPSTVVSAAPASTAALLDATQPATVVERPALPRAPSTWKPWPAVALALAGLGLLGGLLMLRPTGEAPRSVAVLPFHNATQDPNLDYLADGVSEALVGKLARVPGVKVISYSSTSRFRAPDVDVAEVGRTLDVRAVLTGKLMQQGELLVVSTELVDTQDGSHLWGNRFSQPQTDALKLQEDMAQQIAARLQPRLSGDARNRLGRVPTQSSAAYEAYLRGRFHVNRRTEGSLRQAITFFEQAVAQDPGFALAHVGLADAHTLLASDFYGATPPLEGSRQALESARKALELDDTLGEAHAVMAAVTHLHLYQASEAERMFRRALELSPNYAPSHHWYSLFLALNRRLDEAAAQIAQAQELDPLSPIISTVAGRIPHFGRRYDEAVAQYARTLQKFPDFSTAHLCLGLTLAAQGKLDDALASLQRAEAITGGHPMVMAWLGYVHAARKETARAEEILARLQSATRYVPAVHQAIVLMGLGRTEAAVDMLLKAEKEGSDYLLYAVVEPFFDGLRDHERYRALMGRLGMNR